MSKRRDGHKKLVFISHAHEDADLAEALKAWLGGNLLNAVEIFVSSNEESNPPGTDWATTIRAKLQHTSIGLCLMSPYSIERKWLYFEAGAVIVQSVRVVPVCISGVRMKDLQPPLSFNQALELRGPDAERRLVNCVADAVGLDRPKKITKLTLPSYNYSMPAGWLFNEADIAGYEQSFNGSEIWIVSANLDHDVISGKLADAVAYNLNRGISYMYVVPNKDEIYPAVDSIRKLHGSSNLPPKFKFVDRDQFDNITETNITIYNPVADKQADSEVFLELPIHPDPLKRKWTKVDKHFSDKIIGRIRNLPDIEQRSKSADDKEDV